MTERKRILIFIDWYLPGYKAGGPIRSVAAIVNQLRSEFDFSIVTSDRDFGSEESYPSVVKGEWTNAPDGTRILYCPSGENLKTRFEKILREEKYDLVYFNSLFSRNFTLLPLRMLRKLQLKKKIILAPRGMLGAGALGIKPIRKKVFLSITKITGLFSAVTWHASSEQEEKEIKSVFGNETNVVVAMNLSQPLQFDFSKREKIKGELNLFFLSRISSKKNLLGALQILKSIPAGNKIRFTIFGPIEEPEYWNQCQELIRQMPAEISVQYAGELAHESIGTALENQHVLFFPTLHENFGHVILESFSAACPVLISDQTPWQNLEEHFAGWAFPLAKTELFAAKIAELASMNADEYRKWSEGALQFAKQYSADKNVLEKNRKLFR